MKRGASSVEDGSLELLLDTICNTFGGIIFISLLLIVLINSTSKVLVQDTPKQPIATSTLIEREVIRDRLASQLSRLQKAFAAQRNTTGVLVTADVLESAARLKAEESRHAQTVQEKSAIVGSNNRTQVEIAQVQNEIHASEQQLEELKRQASALKSQVKQALGARARTATIPKMTRAGRLDPVNYFVQYGRLFGPISINNQRNTHDFRFDQVNGQTVIRPIEQNGLVIQSDGSNIPEIQQKLVYARPGYNAVHLYYWEDSFDRFDSLRSAMETRGLTYAVVPWEADDELIFSNRGPELWEQN